MSSTLHSEPTGPRPPIHGDDGRPSTDPDDVDTEDSIPAAPNPGKVLRHPENGPDCPKCKTELGVEYNLDGDPECVLNHVYICIVCGVAF